MALIFHKILSMSLSASVVILAVILFRLLLSGAPKKWSYLLWSVVGFRLCCPVSLRSTVSLFSAVPDKLLLFHPAAGNHSVTAVPTIVEQTLSSPAHPVAIATFQQAPSVDWFTVCGWIWLAGIAAMLAWGMIRYLRLRSLLLDAVRSEETVFESDRIDTPFILGLLQPKIYLPLGLDGARRRYVLAHERFHLRRCDHWCKFFAFIILSIYWFNPLCWLSFYLFNRDMEISCDEHVLAKDSVSGAEYSDSLLSFAVSRRFPGPAPLAFGESDVSRRVKNALRWKRPKPWVTILALLMSVGALAACATNPASRNDNAAGDPKVFKDAVLASFKAADRVMIICSDGTSILIRSNDILQSLAAEDWQGVSPEEPVPSGTDCIKLQTDSWTIETYSVTDYIRFVPASGDGGWLWLEEYSGEGSLYHSLQWLREHEKTTASDWRNADIEVEFGVSGPFSQEDQELAVDVIMNYFAQFGDGFQMKQISYDHEADAKEIEWLNGHKHIPGAGSFTEAVCFISDFHTPSLDQMTEQTMNPDADYTGWQWWLARPAGGDWIVVDMGY